MIGLGRIQRMSLALLKQSPLKNHHYRSSLMADVKRKYTYEVK
jgi:hypothetical protein